MPACHSELSAIEHRLWKRDSRFDPDQMDALFADDFFEIGRSGRRYSRSEMLFPATAAEDIPASLHAMQILPLDENLAQVLYQSELRYDDGIQWAWRSSLWDRSSGQWQLRFHQGTPTQAPQ